MLAEVFKNKFEFSSNYFAQKLLALKDAAKKEKFPQSIIFEGLDIFGQLHFSLELARLLNCQKDGGQDCDCINCKWIKQGKHPAVVLVSPIDFKNNDTGSKTVISVKQSLGITKALEQTSDYHRVFILLDAKKQTLSEIDKENLRQYAQLDYALPDEDWLPCSINHKIFQHTATNAILKAVEEPPERTTFIFLTNNREDLIPTIVSRSQVFKMPSDKPFIPTSFIEEVFSKYPDFDLFDAFEISTAMQEYIKENGCEAKTVLIMLEEYISKLIRNNYENEILLKKFKNDIQKISISKKQLFASMTTKTVFDSLLIEISNKGG